MFNLKSKGFEVLTRADAPLYSHAHARLPEIIKMAEMTDAATVLPIHGDANLRAHCRAAMEKIGQNTMSAANGDVIRVTKNGSYSINPPTKDKAPLIGFKTLQGRDWTRPPLHHDQGARREPGAGQ